MRVTFEKPTRLVVRGIEGAEQFIWACEIEVAVMPDKEIAKAVAAKEKEAKSAAAAKEKRGKLYPVVNISKEDLNAMSKGEWDSPEFCSSAAGREKIINAACEMRRLSFKMDAISYSVHDAQVMSSILSGGIKPSTLARAIRAASMDEFWSKHGDITIQKLAVHAARLSAQYENIVRDPARKASVVIDRLRAVDPQMAKQIAQDLARASDPEKVELLRQAQARINIG